MDINNQPTINQANDREALFQKAIDEFPDHLITAKIRDGRIISLLVGDGVAEVIEYDPLDLANEPDMWFQVIHPADEHRVRDAYSRLSKGEPLSEVYRIFSKSGQVKWIRLTAITGKEAKNGISWIIGIVSDASAEKPTSDSLIQYKQLLEKTPNPACLRNTIGQMIFCNQAYIDLIGYNSLEEAQLSTFTNVIPAEDMKTFEQDILPKILSGPWQGELRLKRKDGNARSVRLSTNTLYDPDGKPVGMFAIFLDLTELKKTTQALTESEEKYRTLVERANDGIVVLQDSKIMFVNDLFAEMSGYTKERLIGRDFTEFLTPEESVALYDLYSQRMAGEHIPHTYECTLTRANGERIEVEINAGIINYQGKTADLVLARDIRRRKRAEEALRESEERFRTLVDNVDAIIVRIGPDMHPITISEQIEKWTGLKSEQLIDDPTLWLNLITSDDFDRVHSALSKATSDKKTVTVEIKLKHISNETHWVRGRLTPRFNEKGDLVYWDGVGMDITERVEAIERETRHSRLISTLVEMSQRFVSTRDITKILNTAIKSAAHQLKSACSIYKIDPTTDRAFHIAMYSEKPEISRKIDDAFNKLNLTGNDIFGEQGAHVDVVRNIAEESEKSAKFAKLTGLRSVITIPIFMESEPFGILAAGRTEEEKSFDDEDLWFMSEVASHVSAALTNASLYSRQARIAETLQRSLIPEEVAVPGLEAATSYIPAISEVGVGGDFFDVISFENGKVGIVVGDVSGKGLDAAIHTAEAKYMLRGFANQNPEPSYVISSVNEALCSYMSEFTFITMFYGLIDPENHYMDYVNAGHESPLVLCKNTGRVYDLAPCGMILGIQRKPHYIAHRIELANDDYLFCYTDGVTDVKCNGDRFGFDRLTKTIAQSNTQSCQELLDYVCSEVRECSKGIQADDQVVVVVRVK